MTNDLFEARVYVIILRWARPLKSSIFHQNRQLLRSPFNDARISTSSRHGWGSYIKYHRHRVVEGVESCLHVNKISLIDEIYGWLLRKEPERAAEIAFQVKEAIRNLLKPTAVGGGAGWQRPKPAGTGSPGYWMGVIDTITW